MKLVRYFLFKRTVARYQHSASRREGVPRADVCWVGKAQRDLNRLARVGYPVDEISNALGRTAEFCQRAWLPRAAVVEALLGVAH